MQGPSPMFGFPTVSEAAILPGGASMSVAATVPASSSAMPGGSASVVSGDTPIWLGNRNRPNPQREPPKLFVHMGTPQVSQPPSIRDDRSSQGGSMQQEVPSAPFTEVRMRSHAGSGTAESKRPLERNVAEFMDDGWEAVEDIVFWWSTCWEHHIRVPLMPEGCSTGSGGCLYFGGWSDSGAGGSSTSCPNWRSLEFMDLPIAGFGR